MHNHKVRIGKVRERKQLMADTQEIAFITSLYLLTIVWSFIGYWFAANILLSRHTTTNITWTLLLIIWLIATIIFLSFIIRSLFHGKTEDGD